MLNVLLQVVPPDWSQIGVDLIHVAVPILTAIFIWLGRLAVEKVPRALLPIVAVVLGTGVDYILSVLSGGGFNVVVGALLGASATWLRELVDTIMEHGVNA
jgi:hypothetical protein